MKMNRVLTLGTFAVVAGFLSGCDDATIASQNLSRAADMFEINRRIISIMALLATICFLLKVVVLSKIKPIS